MVHYLPEMKIDYKITTWERFDISDEHEEELREFMKKNPQADAMDVYHWACDNGFEPEVKKIDGVDKILNPEDNGGQATLEILLNEKTIFSNEKKLDNPASKD